MYTSSVLPLAALLSLAQAHNQILKAVGIAGSPASVGFQVDAALARNCTGISPCQQDATIIRDAEITANLVNMCGRTEIAGNIDVGENTENALAAGAVTMVQSGSVLTVTIHQVNADGAGPFFCDLDETGNAGGVTLSQNLSVTNNVPGSNGFSQAKEQDFNMTVTMPTSFNCTGASTGNVCTVRCRNNAVAGPFGGCFAVQQIDTTAKVNTPQNIATAQKLAAVLAQVQQNKADLPAAVAANQNDGSAAQIAAVAAVNAMLAVSITTKAAPVQTPSVLLGAAAAAAPAAGTTTSSAAAAATSKAAKKKAAGKNNKREAGMRWVQRSVDEEES